MPLHRCTADLSSRHVCSRPFGIRPAIQSMVTEKAAELDPKRAQDIEKLQDHDGVADVFPWWMKNLYDMETRTKGEGGGEDEDSNGDEWWMQNLFGAQAHAAAPGTCHAHHAMHTTPCTP